MQTEQNQLEENEKQKCDQKTKKLESTFKCSVVKKNLLFPKTKLSTSKQKYLEATVKTSDGEISKTSCF